MTTTKICPFCDPAQEYRFIDDGKLMRVIYPKAPACRYHVLIVPKRHAAQFDTLSQDEVAEAFAFVKKLNAIAKANLPNYVGYNLLSNNGGPSVRQHVPHCHIHIFLRMGDESADPFAPRDSATPSALTEAQLNDMRTLRALMTAK